MAEVFGAKFHYDDHDTDLVNEAPPVQNTWYEVFHAYDVRHLYCVIRQVNDEAAAKTVEVRWTIDGNVYLANPALASNQINWVFRNYLPSSGGTGGLANSTAERMAAFYQSKRGKDYKVEIRITAALGTNQTLTCWCVRETEDLT